MLAAIVENKRRELAEAKRARPLDRLYAGLEKAHHEFLQALERRWAVIAECKLASPVKGRLSTKTVPELAAIYGTSGAAALSVLTDSHFLGSLDHIGAARAAAELPVLRKDFILEEYQVVEARAAGAHAVLLIAAILADGMLASCLQLAGDLGMDCLVEVHTREELIRVQRTKAQIIGINNRDLTNFTVDIERTFALLPFRDPDRLAVSESGIRSGADVRRLQEAGLNGILAGEGLVRAGDIARKVREFNLQEKEGENDDA